MSMQTRYGLTFGSGENGMRFESYLRAAAHKEGLEFPVWIKSALTARAEKVLGKFTAVPDVQKKDLTAP